MSILCDFSQAARGFVADSVLSERDLHELAVATLHIDHRQDSLKAALHLLVAVYSQAPELLDRTSLPPRLVAALGRAVNTYGGADDTVALARQPIAADIAAHDDLAVSGHDETSNIAMLLFGLLASED